MKKVYLETPEAVIKALKDGKEVRDKYGSICKLVDGIIISKLNNFFEIGKPIRSVNKPYIFEEEPLKIEVGKFYKTRSGNKVIVLHVNKNDISGFPVSVAVVGSTDTLYFVSRTGGHPNDFTSEWDLVAPWEE